jgi:hypothetical protein
VRRFNSTHDNENLSDEEVLSNNFIEEVDEKHIIVKDYHF